MIKKSLLLLVLSLFFLPAISNANTATVKARCYSFGLLEASTSAGDTIYFTTDDNSSSVPLHYEEGINWYFSGEIKPPILGGSEYWTDYLAEDYSGIYEYGYGIFNFPDTDSNNNGFPDFLEIERSTSGSFTGTASSQWNLYNASLMHSLSGTLIRNANNADGTYSGTLTNSYGSFTLSGSWEIFYATGSISYDDNEINVSLNLTGSGETQIYTGSTTYVRNNPDQIAINSFTLTSNTGEPIAVYPFTLVRDGIFYRGNFEINDGNPSTSWRDYYKWQLEIKDNNDWDADGIPDLSDPKVAVTKKKTMPWLTLLLLDENNPTVNISTPSDNSTHNIGDAISFLGSAKDNKGNILTDDSLVWTSSLDGQIGTGTSFESSDLSLGSHKITLTATDSDGLTGKDSIIITIVDPNAPTSISISSNTNILLASGGNEATVNVTVIPYDPENGSIPDGTNIEFEVISGEASLTSSIAETLNGNATIRLLSMTQGSLILKATVQGTNITDTVSFDVISSFSDLFSKSTNLGGVLIERYAQAGSKLTLTIQNNSNMTFNLNKFEFRYNGSAILSTTDISLLSGGQLTPNESIGIVVTTGTDYLLNNLTSAFILSDPIEGKEFEVSYDWVNYSF